MDIKIGKRVFFESIIFVVSGVILVYLLPGYDNPSLLRIFSKIITIQISVVFLFLFAIMNLLLIIYFLYTIYTENKKILANIEKEKQIEHAKDEFISLISHQLRTPLSAINWYAEALVLEDAGKINKKQKTYLENLHESGARMVSLINSIIEVSRIDLHTFVANEKSADIQLLIENIIKSFQEQIKTKKLKLQKDYGENLHNVLIDERYIKMIVEHLLSNSIKYTRARGLIKINSFRKGNFINISIEDNGYGIPEEDMSSVFSKLFRASNIKEIEPNGTGIGLYIVKSVVDYAGGKISVESKEGIGSKFSVTLPINGQ